MVFNYDLKTCPVTYDFVTFLTLCEQLRLLRGSKKFYVYIDDDISDFQVSCHPDWRWRIYNLLIPLAGMMPNCEGVGIGKIGERVGYSTIDIDREIYFDKDFKHITAGKTALDMACPTTNLITLRHSHLYPERNSNIKEWLGVFNNEFNHEFIDDFECSPSIYNINVELRMAMYMKSKMNWFVAHGCGALAMFNPNIPYRVFKPVTESVSCTTLDHIKRETGMSPGDNPHIASENQKYIWKDDNYDAIFNQFISLKPCENH